MKLREQWNIKNLLIVNNNDAKKIPQLFLMTFTLALKIFLNYGNLTPLKPTY